MNEKDPLEELFRREAEESLFQDKPREVVWQKIENNLHSKTETPIKNFIQSVWFSAAVFALIAVPYFYFFLENMNKHDENMTIVKQSVENIISSEQENQNISTEIESTIIDAPVIVKNEVKSVLKTEKKDIVLKKSKHVNDSLENEDFALENYSIASVANAGIDSSFIAKSDSSNETAVLASADIDKLVLAKNIAQETNKESQVSQSKIVKKEISPLSFQRNRFIIQDKVTRVSFEFIRKNNNRLIFYKEGIKLTLVRDNGQVKILTNTNNIKPEILSHIQSNKELIYNYYINFEAKRKK